MSFKDDLCGDLHNVYFADFNDEAEIAGVSITGFLDINAYRWADLESNQKLFSAPRHCFPDMGRGTEVTINGVLFKYVRHYPDDDLIRVVVA